MRGRPSVYGRLLLVAIGVEALLSSAVAVHCARLYNLVLPCRSTVFSCDSHCRLLPCCPQDRDCVCVIEQLRTNILTRRWARAGSGWMGVRLADGVQKGTGSTNLNRAVQSSTVLSLCRPLRSLLRLRCCCPVLMDGAALTRMTASVAMRRTSSVQPAASLTLHAHAALPRSSLSHHSTHHTHPHTHTTNQLTCTTQQAHITQQRGGAHNTATQAAGRASTELSCTCPLLSLSPSQTSSSAVTGWCRDSWSVARSADCLNRSPTTPSHSR